MYRKFLNWEWYDDINTKCLFLHLLLKANVEDREWYGIKINRGQLVTSLNLLSKETGLSIRSIRTSLDKLISTGELTSKATSRYRIITVCKYEDYQELKNFSDKQATSAVTSAVTTVATSKRQAKMCKNQTDNTSPTNELTSKATNEATNKATTNKEYKEEKKKENKIFIPFSHKDSSETSSDISKDEIEVSRFLDFFNQTLKEYGSIIPKIRSITGKRLSALRARCREFGSVEIDNAVKKAAQSDFLNGKNNWGFVANFDWIFRPNKFSQIIEGTYDNHKQITSGKNGTYTKTEQQALERAEQRQEIAELISRIRAEDTTCEK